MSIQNEKEIKEMIKALFPIIYIVTYEEKRVVEKISEILQGKDILTKDKVVPKLKIWSHDIGLINIDNRPEGDSKLSDPIEILEHIKKTPENDRVIYILRDFDPFLNDNLVQRYFRTFTEDSMVNVCIIILSPILNLPQRLIKCIPIIEWSLPTYDERSTILEYHKDSKNNLGEEQRDKIIKAMAGLTELEAINVIARQSAIDKKLILDIDLLNKEKLAIAKKNPVLEIYQPNETDKFTNLGGWDNAKEFITKRKSCFSEDFVKFGGDPIKGVLLFGIPGCGKSLFCQCIGYEFGLPVIKLSLAAVMAQSGGIVGQSENWLREAFRTIEAVAPCIVFMDEIEKGAAGMESSGQSDGGMTSRTLSIFLDKLQNRSAPFFIVATANNVRSLPAEMVRPGRWDRLMFVGLPNIEERKKIIEIHLNKRGFNLNNIDVDFLSKATDTYTGAEIEQVIKDSIIEAFISTRKKLTTEILMQTVKTVVPQSRYQSDTIQGLIRWADTNGALNVSSGEADGETANILKIVK